MNKHERSAAWRRWLAATGAGTLILSGAGTPAAA